MEDYFPTLFTLWWILELILNKNAIFSEITLKRWGIFKRHKRAYYSLVILGLAFFLSLFSPILVNDKPLILKYNGKIYFPALFFYAANKFTGSYNTEANYLELKKSKILSQGKNWAIFPPIPHDPLHSYLSMEGTPPHPPSLKHWLGTDRIARDLLSRLIHGFRICMSFAVVLTLISTILGVIIGGLQGYAGGKIDIVLQRFIEIWSALPFLYVVILIGSIYGRGFLLLIFVLSLFQWIGLSFYMRAEFLKIKNLTFVKAAKSLGLSNKKIFFSEILPNSLNPVITLIPFSIISGIGSLTALDFLGFGVQPPTPSWGELINQGLMNLYAPWIAFSTVAALFITLLLSAFIGEGIREAFDPKSKLS